MWFSRMLLKIDSCDWSVLSVCLSTLIWEVLWFLVTFAYYLSVYYILWQFNICSITNFLRLSFPWLVEFINVIILVSCTFANTQLLNICFQKALLLLSAYLVRCYCFNFSLFIFCYFFYFSILYELLILDMK